MKDLFGKEIEYQPKNPVKGYAQPPGSCPSGETCRSCGHKIKRGRFWKCRLVRQTHGPGTDIRLKSAACSAWEKGDAQQNPLTPQPNPA
jgi:hypothetical protein